MLCHSTVSPDELYGSAGIKLTYDRPVRSTGISCRVCAKEVLMLGGTSTRGVGAKVVVVVGEALTAVVVGVVGAVVVVAVVI